MSYICDMDHAYYISKQEEKRSKKKRRSWQARGLHMHVRGGRHIQVESRTQGAVQILDKTNALD